MKHIKFKRKAKAFATLGGLATVSSLVLAACADNSATTQDTVSAEKLAKTNELLEAQKSGVVALKKLEQKHFSDVVDILNFEKDLNKTILDTSKDKLGTSSSEELGDFTQNQNSDAKITTIKAKTVFGILKKMVKDIEKASKKEQNPLVTTDEFQAFKKTVKTLETAANELVAKFDTLPATSETTTALKTSAESLKEEVAKDQFDATVLKTKMDSFVTEVRKQRTETTGLVTAALALTKATSELKTFINTKIAKYVEQNSDFSLILNTLVSIISEDVLGMPGADLFANKDEVPAELTSKKTSTKVYSVFAKLFRVTESLKDLTESYQRLGFIQALLDKKDSAIQLLAKNSDDLLFNVDFARLNSFLSFGNTNLLDIYNSGSGVLFKTTGLATIVAGFVGLESGFKYISGTGSDDLEQKLEGFKKTDTTKSTDYTTFLSKLKEEKTKFTKAVEQLESLLQAFKDLNTKIQELNAIIRTSDGLIGILQLLSKVEEVKTSIKTINSFFDAGSGQKSDFMTAIENAKTSLAVSGDLGRAFKTLSDAVKTNGTSKDELKKIVQFANDTTYDLSKIQIINNFTVLPDRYEASLKSSALSSDSTLSSMRQILNSSYAPSPSSELMTQLTALSAEYKLGK